MIEWVYSYYQSYVTLDSDWLPGPQKYSSNHHPREQPVVGGTCRLFECLLLLGRLTTLLFASLGLTYFSFRWYLVPLCFLLQQPG